MKNDGSIFGISKEEFERRCSIKVLEGDLTQTPIVEGETFEPCLRGAEKILNDPKMLKRVRDILTKSNYGLDGDKIVNLHTKSMPFTEEDLTLENIKLKYDIQDDEIILRLRAIKFAIKDKKQKDMSNDELISFLNSIMNYDDMQIWLIRKQMDGVELTLNDKLKKFFELKSNEDILRLYDVAQNCDQNNINGISKTLKKDV